MNVEEALIILDTVLQKEFLNNIQEQVFRGAWAGQTYSEMAESFGYNANYIKDVGYKLWKLLSKVFDEEVTKTNFRSVLRRRSVAPQRCMFMYEFPVKVGELQVEDRVSRVSTASEKIASPKK